MSAQHVSPSTASPQISTANLESDSINNHATPLNTTSTAITANSATSPTVRLREPYHVTKRAPKACSNCHRRKVRCDAHLHPEGQPCSYCNSTGAVCVLLPGRRGSTYQKTKDRLGGSSSSSSTPKTARKSNNRGLSIDKAKAEQEDDKLNVLYNQLQQESSSSNYVAPYNTTTHSILSPSIKNDLPSPSSPLSATHEITNNPSMSDEHVWVQFLDKVHDHSRTGLLEHQLAAQQAPNQFLRPDGYATTRENSTDREGDTKRRVLVYNGESMLDGAVPQMEGLHTVHDGPSGANDSTSSFLEVQAAGPPPSWTTIVNPKHITEQKTVPEDDKAYLLEGKKVNVFPPLDVCDRLVKSFFKHIYPNLPILDRPSFLRGYRRMIHNNSVYSLLLMHAVFYAATYHASTSLIQACGFTNRLAARAYFFSRAKALHGLDAEKEHLFVIQSCILMTIWWTRYEEEKETRFFLASAVLLSQRMGMHRTIRGGWGLGSSERRLWKRIHWTLFNRDHISASSLGKPSFIRSTDVDVGDLTEEDFLENWGNINENDAKQFCPPQTIVNIKYTMELVKLAKIYERIHCYQYATRNPASHADLEDIANSLQEWRNMLPSELSTSRYDEFRTWTPENFWPILLQIVHDRAVSLHFRPRCSPSKRKIWGAAGEGPLDEHNTLKDREKARKAVVASANSTFRLVEDLLRHDLLRYCPPIIQTPLFIAMIVYAEEIKLSPTSSPRFNLATNKINLGMMALGELRKVYAAASWFFRMFEYIIERKFAPIRTPEITSPGNATPMYSEIGSSNEMPIDPLLTGNPITPPAAPLASGHCFWNMNLDPDLPMDTSPTFDPSAQTDNNVLMGNTVGENSDFEFDLAWMAMSGLAGDIPFHFEGGAPNKGAGKAGASVGTGDLMSLLGLGEPQQLQSMQMQLQD